MWHVLPPSCRAERIAVRSSSRQLVVFVVAVVLAGWKSYELLFAQQAGTPLPGATWGGACCVVFLLWSHNLPVLGKYTLPKDAETDYIVALSFLVLGCWMVFQSDIRLGSDFWLWRFDLMGLSLVLIALAAAVGGTRYALWIMVPFLCICFSTMPGVQLLFAGASPSVARVALTSALLGMGGLFLARPGPMKDIGVRAVAGWGIAIVIALLSIGLNAVVSLPLYMLSVVCGIVGAFCMEVFYHYQQRGRTTIGLPNQPLVRGRVVFVVFLLLVSAVFQFSVSGAVPETRSVVGRLVAPSGGITANYKIYNVHVVAYGVGTSRSLNRADEVILATSSRQIDLLTYPVSYLVHVYGALCPNSRVFYVHGVPVTAAESSDTANGYTWTFYTFYVTGRHGGYQRVSLLTAIGTAGGPVPMPLVAPDVVSASMATLGQYVANRHLACNPAPPRELPGVHSLLSRLLFEVRR